jgi:hypothetical protein
LRQNAKIIIGKSKFCNLAPAIAHVIAKAYYTTDNLVEVNGVLTFAEYGAIAREGYPAGCFLRSKSLIFPGLI